MSNNATAQTMRDELAALNREMAAMRAAFAANAQGTVCSGITAPTIPTIYDTPPPPPPPPAAIRAFAHPRAPQQQVAYAAMPHAPPVTRQTTPYIPTPTQYGGYGPPPQNMMYTPPHATVPVTVPPPQPYGQQQQLHQGRGWGGQGRKGRGAGRGARARRESLAHARQPPVNPNQQGHVMPQAGWQRGQGGRGGNNQKSKRKFYNNMNMCFSCGFDIPWWHTSKTCPPECRRAGHQENCDRSNYASYLQAGHNVRLKKYEADIMPTNPGPHQA